ncbi:glypican-5, partial [Biomphalaria glabrata]
AVLSECASTLLYTNGTSCCSSVMERKFLQAAEDYLREHIQMINSRLKSRITQSLKLFQEHLHESVKEAQNRMSEKLTSLYKIPRDVHKKIMDDFFSQLTHYLNGEGRSGITEIIEGFFRHLFPLVYDYVIMDSSKTAHGGREFHACLMSHYTAVEPFGNLPAHLGKKVSFAFQRARVFTETLKIMIHTVNASDKVTVDNECKRAVARLQYCSMCSARQETRPCRGFCINVMRGCLSKISEISSSWDDLVIAFQNLQVGMFKQSTAQELLSYMDINITDAMLQASEDGPRIYKEATSRCKNTSEDSKMVFKKLPAPTPTSSTHPPASHAKSIRADISTLVLHLEDSKGFLHRIADGLCKTPIIYDQEMQSETCWNGSTVGRYMHSVPEAHIISQVQSNPEVKVTLIPDTHLIRIKDVLVHMNKNISGLFNEELMLNDVSYKSLTGSGDGSKSNRDVIIDDEDFDTSGEGSASSGDDTTTKDIENGFITPTSSPDIKIQGHSSPRSPHHPKAPDGKGNTGSSRHSPPVLLLLCAVLFLQMTSSSTL